MSHKPPFARMRQIQRDSVRQAQHAEPQVVAEVPVVVPANITQALAAMPEPEAVFEAVPEPVVEFTPNDFVPEPLVEVPEPVAEEVPEIVAEPVEETPEPKPEFDANMTKNALKKIATSLGIDTMGMTKDEILDALNVATED